MRFGFVGPSYSSKSLNADAQRCLNWYVEAVESGRGKSPAVLYPTPGLAVFSVLVGPSVRGQLALNKRAFAISGTNFYEIFSDGSNLARGIVADDGLPASMAASSTQLFIVSGGVAYSYNLATNVLAAVAGMLGVPALAGFSDGYFIALLADSNKFQISALLDATVWPGLSVAQVSVFPDEITSMIVDHREVWLFGRKSSQVYYNSGNVDFPFEPIPGAFIEEGSASRNATVRIDNSVFWLGAGERGQGVGWRAQGYTPTRVSNHAVEQAWQSYSRMDDSVAYGYQDQGHSFWVVMFPTAKATWVYDAATGAWHERGFWDAASASYTAHLGWNHVYAFGRHLVGSWKSGNVYQMSVDLNDDAGTPIRRMRRAPHISAEQEFLFHRSLQVDLEPGLGLQVGQGDDPQVSLRWSNDAAKTWSNEYAQAAGKVGEYSRRVVWRRLGRSRDRVYEMVVSDPIPWRITDAYLQVDAGAGGIRARR